MKTARITLTANAGIIVEAEGKTVLVDALHSEAGGDFAGLDSELLSRVWRYFGEKDPDMYLTSHLHPDHYSHELVSEAERRWPKCVFIPAQSQECWYFKDRGIEVTALRTPHDGKQYMSEDNYAMFIRIGSFKLLVSGDCSTKAPEYLSKLMNGVTASAAVLNFPWITLSKARKAVEEIIKPQNIVIVHLPTKSKDHNNYRQAAYFSAERINGVKVYILGDPMQSTTVQY